MNIEQIPNLREMLVINDILRSLDIEFVFVGAAVMAFYCESWALPELRPTKDIDSVVRANSARKFRAIEAVLNDSGFSPSPDPTAPKCRWIYKEITVDILPSRALTGMEYNRWFIDAIDAPIFVAVADGTIPVASVPVFLATKLESHISRGDLGQRYAIDTNKDLEDIVIICDSRNTIVEDVRNAHEKVREFIAQSFSTLLSNPLFSGFILQCLPCDRMAKDRHCRILLRMKEIAMQSPS